MGAGWKAGSLITDIAMILPIVGGVAKVGATGLTGVRATTMGSRLANIARSTYRPITGIPKMLGRGVRPASVVKEMAGAAAFPIRHPLKAGRGFAAIATGEVAFPSAYGAPARGLYRPEGVVDPRELERMVGATRLGEELYGVRTWEAPLSPLAEPIYGKAGGISPVYGAPTIQTVAEEELGRLLGAGYGPRMQPKTFQRFGGLAEREIVLGPLGLGEPYVEKIGPDLYRVFDKFGKAGTTLTGRTAAARGLPIRPKKVLKGYVPEGPGRVRLTGMTPGVESYEMVGYPTKEFQPWWKGRGAWGRITGRRPAALGQLEQYPWSGFWTPDTAKPIPYEVGKGGVLFPTAPEAGPGGLGGFGRGGFGRGGGWGGGGLGALPTESPTAYKLRTTQPLSAEALERLRKAGAVGQWPTPEVEPSAVLVRPPVDVLGEIPEVELEPGLALVSEAVPLEVDVGTAPTRTIPITTVAEPGAPYQERFGRMYETVPEVREPTPSFPRPGLPLEAGIERLGIAGVEVPYTEEVGPGVYPTLAPSLRPEPFARVQPQVEPYPFFYAAPPEIPGARAPRTYAPEPPGEGRGQVPFPRLPLFSMGPVGWGGGFGWKRPSRTEKVKGLMPEMFLHFPEPLAPIKDALRPRPIVGKKKRIRLAPEREYVAGIRTMRA